MKHTDLLKAIYASATDHAIISMDNHGIITSWNAGAQQILGYRPEEIIGKSGSILFAEEDSAQGVPLKEFEIAVRTGRAADFRWHVRKDGSCFWGEGVVTPLRDESGTRIGFLKIMYDNTERKRAEDELLHSAHHDALTGVSNRMYFEARLTEMIAAASRSNEMLLLQLIDLDYFKQINDSLGHAIGDLVLQQAAQRMRAVLRETDFIARLGGDEFVVIEANARMPEAGASLANKLLDTLSQPFLIDGYELLISASIGIAVFPQDGAQPDDLLKKADFALYRVKSEGRGGFSYFTEQLDAQAREWGRNLIELRRAIEQHEFWLAYQPEVDCETGRIVSLEALLRCGNPALSKLPMVDLISLAAKAGLMPKLGIWVLNEACKQQSEWKEAGLPQMKIAVNFCPNELMNKGVMNKINSALGQSGLSAHDLEIEITERQIYSCGAESFSILQDIRSLGISIVLDDFGTGYSSLSYLRRLPIDRLKLDRGFLRDIPYDHQSCAIAHLIITLAHTLNIEVIAEGVESADQVDFCKRNKCDVMQGFYFSPPLPAKEVTSLLLTQFASI